MIYMSALSVKVDIFVVWTFLLKLDLFSKNMHIQIYSTLDS